MQWLCPTGCGSCGLLVLRVTAGVIFVMHGYAKLFGGMEGFTGMVAGMGFPLPTLFAYFAALSEFVGGIALILGLWTQAASIFLAIVMLVALVMVKKFSFPRADVDLALLGSVLALYCLGPGRYSLFNKKNGCCAGACGCGAGKGKEGDACCGGK